MSPARGDASQGTFFEVYGNLIIRYFLYYKKSVQDGIRDSFAHMSPARGDVSQGTFSEVYLNLVIRYFYTIKAAVQNIPLLFCLKNLLFYPMAVIYGSLFMNHTYLSYIT